MQFRFSPCFFFSLLYSSCELKYYAHILFIVRPNWFPFVAGVFLRRVMSQSGRVIAGLSLPQRQPGSGHLGFVVDEVALGQIFSEHFYFPCQSSFH
jgi:hypothetical protein